MICFAPAYLQGLLLFEAVQTDETFFLSHIGSPKLSYTQVGTTWDERKNLLYLITSFNHYAMN